MVVIVRGPWKFVRTLARFYTYYVVLTTCYSLRSKVKREEALPNPP